MQSYGCRVHFDQQVTSILIFIAFYVRRRRRRARIEHDTAVSATLAAAGFKRSPLDDDMDGPSVPFNALKSLALTVRIGVWMM